MFGIPSQVPVQIGTAGWAIPKQLREFFGNEGSVLERYSQRLNSVEINSSFYRIHKPDTYFKWAASVPTDFKFSVKLYRYFTQAMRLKETGPLLKEVLDGFSNLGTKWGALLVQLPPSLEFNPADAESFIQALRSHYTGTIVWEPRHRSWAEDRALDLLADYRISKVRAHPDPCYVPRARRARVETAIYYRLHGKPEIYRSNYEPETLSRLGARIREEAAQKKEIWCVFDNTTFGFATENALELTYGNSGKPGSPPLWKQHHESGPRL